MRSQSETLVKMANQIGAYFASQHAADDGAAAQAVAAHLKNFWAPPMRQRLIDLQQQHSGAALLPVVRRALTEHHAALTSASARVGGSTNEVAPAGGGDAG